jgi:hypothetical protein
MRKQKKISYVFFKSWIMYECWRVRLHPFQFHGREKVLALVEGDIPAKKNHIKLSNSKFLVFTFLAELRLNWWDVINFLTDQIFWHPYLFFMPFKTKCLKLFYLQFNLIFNMICIIYSVTNFCCICMESILYAPMQRSHHIKENTFCKIIY